MPTRSQTLAAITAGASSATHVFNAMRPLNQREPGILGTVLDEDIFCELIADGIHVDPVLMRLLAKVKSPTKLLLVTDAISAAGMPDGPYQLGEMTVEVKKRQRPPWRGTGRQRADAGSGFDEFYRGDGG